MDFLLILLGIGVVFVVAFAASVVLTHLSKAGQLQRVDLEDLVKGGVRPGILLDMIAEVRLMEFEGLEVPPTLLLASGSSRIQAVDPDGRLDGGRGGTALLPGDPEALSGRELSLGTYRIIGILEELPLQHVRIRALERR